MAGKVRKGQRKNDRDLLPKGGGFIFLCNYLCSSNNMKREFNNLNEAAKKSKYPATPICLVKADDLKCPSTIEYYAQHQAVAT
jgi:hypothetical protein